MVLPDATASTSHEFDYSAGDSDNNGSGNNGGNEPVVRDTWSKVFIIAQVAAVVIMLGIFILFIVLIVKLNKKGGGKGDKGGRRYTGKHRDERNAVGGAESQTGDGGSDDYTAL